MCNYSPIIFQNIAKSPDSPFLLCVRHLGTRANTAGYKSVDSVETTNVFIGWSFLAQSNDSLAKNDTLPRSKRTNMASEVSLCCNSSLFMWILTLWKLYNIIISCKARWCCDEKRERDTSEKSKIWFFFSLWILCLVLLRSMQSCKEWKFAAFPSHSTYFTIQFKNFNIPPYKILFPLKSSSPNFHWAVACFSHGSCTPCICHHTSPLKINHRLPEAY